MAESNVKTTRDIVRDQLPAQIAIKDARSALEGERARRSAGKIGAKQQQAALANERAARQSGLSTDQLRAALELDRHKAKSRRLNITV